MDSFKIKVRLKDGFKVTTFLDIRTEINVMIREVMEDIGLVIKKVLSLSSCFIRAIIDHF